jgi:general stress protein 26
MKTRRGLSKTVVRFFLFLCVGALHTSVHAQVNHALPPDRSSLIATAREIMKTARYCALITLDSAGRPHARAMDPFPPEENMVVWLGTNSKSRKVAEIRRNQHVTLYYFVPEDRAYVTISGRARIVQDANEKSRHWKDEWKDFYPDRKKNFLLIDVMPDRLEVISVKLGIIGDPINWTPAAVTFRNRKLK